MSYKLFVILLFDQVFFTLIHNYAVIRDRNASYLCNFLFYMYSVLICYLINVSFFFLNTFVMRILYMMCKNCGLGTAAKHHIWSVKIQIILYMCMVWTKSLVFAFRLFDQV